MSLSAKSQCLVRIEAVEGIAETLAAADAIEVLADTFPAVNSNNETIARNVARGSLSTISPIPGGRDGSISLQHELAGPVTSAAWTTADKPGFARLLKACGMQETVGIKLVVNATWTAGTVIREGDTITGVDSGETARVLGDFYVGEDLYIFIVKTSSMAFTAADLTWLSSSTEGGTVTNIDSPNPTTAGNQLPCLVFQPIDEEVMAIHGALVVTPPNVFQVGEVVVGDDSGARGTIHVGSKLNPVSASTLAAPYQVIMFINSPAFTVLDNMVGQVSTATVPLLATVLVAEGYPANTVSVGWHNHSLSIETRHNGPIRKIKGARGNWTLDVKNKDRPMFTFEFNGAGLAPADGVNVTWGSGTTNQIPPVTVGSSLFIDGSFSPLYGEMAYQSNNELTLRDSPTDSSASGYLSNRIVNRAPTVTLQSETVRAAILDFNSRGYTKTQMRSKQIFSSSIAGNSFEVRCRGLVVDENSPTDKDGLLADDTTMSCNSAIATLDSVTGATIGRVTNEEIYIYMY